MENTLVVSQLPWNPPVPFLSIYPKELKERSLRDVFILTFTTAKRWEESKCLSVDEWVNKIWTMHTVYMGET